RRRGHEEDFSPGARSTAHDHARVDRRSRRRCDDGAGRLRRMNSPSVVRRFRRNLRDYGLVVALWKTLRWATKWVYDARTYRIYRIDLREATAVPQSNGTLTFRFVGAGEQSLIEQIERIEDWLHNRLDGRLRAGGLCMAALDGYRVVGFNLVAFGSIEVPVIRGAWCFHPATAWSEQITVRPAWRSKGVA